MAKRTINARVGQEKVIDAIRLLGIPITKSGRRFFINLRGEKTPSAVINKDGSFYDFGSGESGTLIDILMRTKNLSLQDAINETKKLLDINSIETESLQMERQVQFQREKIELDSKKLNKKVNYFIHLAKQDEHQKQFLELLEELLPSIAQESKRLEIANLFRIGIRTNPTPMLTMPIMNENNKIVNIWKYSKHSEPKILFESGGTEMAFPLNKFREFSRNDNILLVCEGQKDVLNAIANGYDAVTAGSCACIFKDKHLEFFKSKRVVVYGDYDEGGEKFSKRIKEQLGEIAKEVLIVPWERIFLKNGLSEPKKGFDLTDLLELKKDEQ